MSGESKYSLFTKMALASLNADAVALIVLVEKAVLNAMTKARLVCDPHHGRHIFEYSEDELDVCEAELARRGEKP